MWTQFVTQVVAGGLLGGGASFLLQRLGARARAELLRQVSEGAFSCEARILLTPALMWWTPVRVLITKDVLLLEPHALGAWGVLQVRRSSDERPLAGWFVQVARLLGNPRLVGKHVEIPVKTLYEQRLLFETSDAPALLRALREWEAGRSPVPPDHYR